MKMTAISSGIKTMGHNIHLVTLGLGPEIFAVPVGCVIEILAMRDLFRVPDAPPYLAGLTEVREQAVPVIDLRRRLGLPPSEVTHQTRIIVLEVAAGKMVVGLIADRVIEVITLAADRLSPPPQFGARWASDYIAGVGRHGSSFVIVFDMPKLFSGDEIMHISGNIEAAMPAPCAA
jgi:purine-binding chemotaxis protein CheW